MRLLLTNFGSTGDVQPFLALAVELRRRGHRPLLALSPLFAERAQRLGLAFVPAGPDFSDEEARRVSTAILQGFNPLDQVRRFLAVTMVVVPEIIRDLLRACEGADVIVSGPSQPAGRMVHEVTGIPWASVQLQHMLVPTEYRPPLGFGLPRLPGAAGRAFNRVAAGTVHLLFRRVSAPIINRYRRQVGLPSLWDPLGLDSNSRQLALFAVSPHVVGPPPDWPARFHLTGYFFLDEDEGWQPDEALQSFLAAGPPPVVVNFGSMMHRRPEDLTRLLLRALERAGVRAIVQQGWSGLAGGPLPRDVHAVGFVPHRWLLPRAACVVHHGGAGTTAAVFRAGVPSVFVPHLIDQPAWAEVAQRLGVAGPAVPYRRLSTSALARAIRRTLDAPGMARRAAALGAAIRAEDGVGRASALLEQTFACPLPGAERGLPAARG